MKKATLDQFYAENENLVHFTSKKALKRLSACGLGERVEYEEIFGELREVFIKSFNQFDPERSKFSTYFVMACHNHVTNKIEKMYRIEIRLDSLDELDGDRESGSTMDDMFNHNPMLEAEVALASELNLMRQRLSPFARILFDYSVNPPEFILQEFHAQRAQCTLATSLGLKTSHATEISLQFIANCLKNTSENPETVKCIKKAVDEVKTAVLRVTSA